MMLILSSTVSVLRITIYATIRYNLHMHIHLHMHNLRVPAYFTYAFKFYMVRGIKPVYIW